MYYMLLLCQCRYTYMYVHMQGLLDGLLNTFPMFPLFPVSGDDYISVKSEPILFHACEPITCIEIEIINDTYVEENETFTVTVETMHDRVEPHPDSAVIIIIDEDCEFTLLVLKQYRMKL